MKKGQRFGRLKAVRFDHRDKKNIYWLFKCRCGTDKIYRTGDVNKKTGATKSCGCLRIESRTTHGQKHTRFYNIWCGMLTRIRNSKATEYRYYGGRGLTVVKRWTVFNNFYKDMKAEYDKHVLKHGVEDTTLERKDVTRGYKPSNCKWATQAEQRKNKTNTITFKGETVSEATKRLGGKPLLIYQRLFKGWTIEDAFTLPVGSRRKK